MPWGSCWRFGSRAFQRRGLPVLRPLAPLPVAPFVRPALFVGGAGAAAATTLVLSGLRPGPGAVSCSASTALPARPAPTAAREGVPEPVFEEGLAGSTASDACGAVPAESRVSGHGSSRSSVSLAAGGSGSEAAAADVAVPSDSASTSQCEGALAEAVIGAASAVGHAGPAQADGGGASQSPTPSVVEALRAAGFPRCASVHWVLSLLGRNALLLLVSVTIQMTNILLQLKRPLAEGMVRQAFGNAEEFGAALRRLFVLMVLDKCFNFFQEYVRERALDGFQHELESELVAACLRQDATYFDFHPPAALANRIHGDASAVRKFTGQLVSGTVGLLLSIGGGLREIYHSSPTLMMKMAALFLPLALYFSTVLAVHTHAQRTAGEAWGRRHGSLTESLTNIRTVFACSAEEQELEKYRQRTGEAVAAEVRSRQTGFLLGNSVGMVGSGLHLFLLLMGSRFVQEGTMTGPEVGAMFQQTFNVVGAAGHLIGLTQELTRGLGAVESVVSALEAVPTVPCDAGLALDSDAAHSGLTLRDVLFQYPTRPGEEALSGLSAVIPAGRTTALVGSSGSGKSTVGWLLQRAYDPGAGSVELGGRDLRGVAPRWLRQQIAHVEQEPRLFEGTIRQNIRYGCAGASDAEVEEVASVAGVSEFAAALPLGLDTPVGGFGRGLSGGQKQRVAIARALLKRPKILILDEATSALDMESERRLQKALAERVTGSTVVLIAHRLSTVQSADQIVVLDRGRVVEAGTHGELLSQPTGAYARLARQHGQS